MGNLVHLACCLWAKTQSLERGERDTHKSSVYTTGLINNNNRGEQMVFCCCFLAARFLGAQALLRSNRCVYLREGRMSFFFFASNLFIILREKKTSEVDKLISEISSAKMEN